MPATQLKDVCVCICVYVCVCVYMYRAEWLSYDTT